MMDWLRRILGESAEISMLRAENKRLLDQLGTSDFKVRQARRVAKGMAQVFALLVEPAKTGECHKIRLANRADAQTLALRVEAATHQGQMEPYRCPLCPRHPITLDRHWHIRHVAKAERGRTYEPGRAKPGSIVNRVNPADVARMIERAKR